MRAVSTTHCGRPSSSSVHPHDASSSATLEWTISKSMMSRRSQASGTSTSASGVERSRRWWLRSGSPQREGAGGGDFRALSLHFQCSPEHEPVEEAVRIEEEPALYFTNRTVASAAAMLLWAHFVTPSMNVERPPMARDEFWRHQLDSGAVRVFGQFSYAENLEGDIEQIVRYCQRHSISFTFVVPPSHVELQGKIAEYGLDRESERFLSFLRRLAPTIDFDIPSDLTRDKSRFGDPFHPRMDEEILRESGQEK